MATRTAETSMTSASGGGSARRRRTLREMGLGYLLLAPALLLAFEIVPIFYGLYISMCDWRLGCTRFVGVANYPAARAAGRILDE